MAQEPLASPGPKRRGTAPALRDTRRWEGAGDNGDVFIGQGQWSIHSRSRPTLMRHEVGDAAVQRRGFASPLAFTVMVSFTPLLAPAARPCCVRHAAGTAALIATTRGAARVQARRA